MISNPSSPDLVEISAAQFAFALSLGGDPGSDLGRGPSGTLKSKTVDALGIWFTWSKKTERLPLRSAWLEQTPGPRCSVILHLDSYVNHKVTGVDCQQYTFYADPQHPIVQALHILCFQSPGEQSSGELPKTPLYQTTTLSLPQTHALLEASLQHLFVPSEHISAWPHPLSLSIEPEWPTSAVTDSLDHTSCWIVLKHGFEPSWPQEEDSISPPSTSYWLHNVPLKKLLTPWLGVSTPFQLPLAFAYSFLLHALLPFLPLEWHIVYVEYLDPSLDPNSSFKLHPVQPTSSDCALRQHLGSGGSLLYLPAYGLPPGTSLFNTALPENTLSALPLYLPSDVFQTPAGAPDYRDTAIAHLQEIAFAYNLHALQC